MVGSLTNNPSGYSYGNKPSSSDRSLDRTESRDRSSRKSSDSGSAVASYSFREGEDAPVKGAGSGTDFSGSSGGPTEDGRQGVGSRSPVMSFGYPGGAEGGQKFSVAGAPGQAGGPIKTGQTGTGSPSPAMASYTYGQTGVPGGSSKAPGTFGSGDQLFGGLGDRLRDWFRGRRGRRGPREDGDKSPEDRDGPCGPGGCKPRDKKPKDEDGCGPGGCKPRDKKPEDGKEPKAPDKVPDGKTPDGKDGEKKPDPDKNKKLDDGKTKTVAQGSKGHPTGCWAYAAAAAGASAEKLKEVLNKVKDWVPKDIQRKMHGMGGHTGDEARVIKALGKKPEVLGGGNMSSKVIDALKKGSSAVLNGLWGMAHATAIKAGDAGSGIFAVFRDSGNGSTKTFKTEAEVRSFLARGRPGSGVIAWDKQA
jgi:hypothetical protein